MPLNLEQKKELVKEVSTILADADTILTADYRGLTAIQLGEFRKIARKPGIHIKIVKNNMLKMALKDSEYSSVVEKISGPQILATSSDNPGEFAKLVKNFIDGNENVYQTYYAQEMMKMKILVGSSAYSCVNYSSSILKKFENNTFEVFNKI